MSTTDPDAPAELTIRFARDDFDSILRAEGIDPDTVTVYEWSKFTDSFLDGTAWSDVAALACDRIKQIRNEVSA